jgi:hypothetical protein
MSSLRFILYRLPILYTWKTTDDQATTIASANGYLTEESPAPAIAVTSRNRI